MTNEPCRAELALRGRRGTLTDAGKLALDAHLADCASCRLDQQLFADIDADSAIDIRDGVRIERLTAAARAWARGKRAGRAGERGQRRIWAAAAGLLLLAGTAGAATWWAAREARPTSERQARPTDVRVAEPGQGATAPSDARLTRPPAVAEPAESPRAADRGAPVPWRGGGAAKRTAAALLRQAGAARSAGDAERAMGLYRRLQREFAASPEAALARVPLGDILLDHGRAREALAMFERYLEGNPAGTLVPEALYGRARALAKLGDRPAERRAWQRLLREFPECAYAPLARRRIGEAK
ncbi:MAG: tetratricopeptide repeat protein [Deltaproteobacteria bacterium]|nr:tetratricopeptide repeat protein [Deltaproteobacteria bacterium]